MRSWPVTGSVVLALLLCPVIARPLGTFAAPLALILVLPPMAAALESLGWARRIAAVVHGWVPVRRRPPLLFAAWSVTSALLSLDVAAVAAADVGLEVAGDAPQQRAAQLRAAVLGANAGSMLFPFSNLTNLVLVAASGMAFGAYVGAALVPQLAVALAGTLLLAREGAELPDDPPRASQAGPWTLPAALGGIAAVVTSVVAIVGGFAGWDISWVFAAGAATCCGLAVSAGTMTPIRLVRTLPMLGIAVIVISGILLGPLQDIAGSLPVPGDGPVALIAVALAGGLLAMVINNLPASAVGAVWLAGADPTVIVAWLVGTNILCITTPHGSIATMLSHSVARRRGFHISRRAYLRRAIPDAFLLAGAAMVALVLIPA